jgi:hypothetical protein
MHTNGRNIFRVTEENNRITCSPPHPPRCPVRLAGPVSLAPPHIRSSILAKMLPPLLRRQKFLCAQPGLFLHFCQYASLQNPDTFCILTKCILTTFATVVSQPVCFGPWLDFIRLLVFVWPSPWFGLDWFIPVFGSTLSGPLFGLVRFGPVLGLVRSGPDPRLVSFRSWFAFGQVPCVVWSVILFGLVWSSTQLGSVWPVLFLDSFDQTFCLFDVRPILPLY